MHSLAFPEHPSWLIILLPSLLRVCHLAAAGLEPASRGCVRVLLLLPDRWRLLAPRRHILPDLPRHGFREQRCRASVMAHHSLAQSLASVPFGGGRPRTCFSRMCARASPSPGSWEAACTTPPYIAGSSPARIPRAALDSHPSWPIKEREEAGGGTRTRIYPRDCQLHHAGPFLPRMCGYHPPAARTPDTAP